MPNDGAKLESDMIEFCASIGELILWASAIDGQLNVAIIRTCALVESPLLEPIVAELDVRSKAEILKAHAKHLKNSDWSHRIVKWVKSVEKVNGYRNIVAHHQVNVEDEKLVLFSPQARKVLRSIKDYEVLPAKNKENIDEWVKFAKSTFESGRLLLENLGRFHRSYLGHDKK